MAKVNEPQLVTASPGDSKLTVVTVAKAPGYSVRPCRDTTFPKQ